MTENVLKCVTCGNTADKSDFKTIRDSIDLFCPICDSECVIPFGLKDLQSEADSLLNQLYKLCSNSIKSGNPQLLKSLHAMGLAKVCVDSLAPTDIKGAPTPIKALVLGANGESNTSGLVKRLDDAGWSVGGDERFCHVDFSLSIPNESKLICTRLFIDLSDESLNLNFGEYIGGEFTDGEFIDGEFIDGALAHFMPDESIESVMGDIKMSFLTYEVEITDIHSSYREFREEIVLALSRLTKILS